MKRYSQYLVEHESEFIDIHSVDLQAEYRKYNAELFSNDLPYIPIEIKPMKYGAAVDATRNKLSGRFTLTRLVMSSKYKFTAERLKNVLVHEMIHVWLMHNQVRDTDMHGVWFQRKMREINALGGFTIGTSDVDAVSNMENKKGLYVKLAHKQDTSKYLLTVFDAKYLKEFDQHLSEWYSNMGCDPNCDPLWETYLLLSHDPQLMTYTKPRSIKGLKRYIIKEPYYTSLITDSTLIRRT